MNIKTLIKHLGGPTIVAGWCGIRPPTVSGWKQVPARFCPIIERQTKRQIRCEDLRPDVDWAYLRGTSRTKRASK